jgi:TDG/mug DNA glycosylase family protein
LREGAARLEQTVARLAPRAVVFLGLGAYRTAFRRPKAAIGRQTERIGNAEVWVLPNPSGLQARYQLPELIALFGEVRTAADSGTEDH